MITYTLLVVSRNACCQENVFTYPKAKARSAEVVLGVDWVEDDHRRRRVEEGARADLGHPGRAQWHQRTGRAQRYAETTRIKTERAVNLRFEALHAVAGLRRRSHRSCTTCWRRDEHM